MIRMRLFLLTIALMLMVAALTTPLWFRRSMPVPGPRLHKTLVTGRIKGDFADRPWAGTIVSFGSESSTLKEDGIFRFAVFPGTHLLKVCCSNRFQAIHREIEVEDRDLHFELEAQPSLEISGRVVMPARKPLSYPLKVSVWLIGTNTVYRAVVASDGSFAFHLPEGDWRIELENPRHEYTFEKITLDGVEVHDRKFTISNVHGPSLPLQIVLK